ncbi:MAG TPA: FMN-binding negative transcriptional regulator [Candidatus Koribacter sp.]|jgi:transcriptional regulator
MYTPNHFKQEDLAAVQEAMTRSGFVSLVTQTENGLTATQAPVILDPNEGEHGVLRGHIARANEQWKISLQDREGMAIFLGPNGYVSPNWYAAKREHGRVVPTWNYIAVHAHGMVRFSEDSEVLRGIVTRLTEKHEANSERPWKVTDAPADYVDNMLKAIIAFELRITRLEASWKLNQNRSEADRRGAMEGLREGGNEVSGEMARALERDQKK